MIAKNMDIYRTDEYPQIVRRRDFEVEIPNHGVARLAHIYWVAGERPKTGPLAEEGKESFWLCQLTLKNVPTPVGVIGELHINQPIPGETEAEVFKNVLPMLDQAVPDAIKRAQQQMTAKAIQTPGNLPPPRPPGQKR